MGMDAPITAPSKVTNPRNAPLRKPGSEAVRWYLVELHEKNATAAYGAALGYCWHGPGRPVVARNLGDLAAYGTSVIDHVLKREGVHIADIIEAGSKAYAMCIDGLVFRAELEEALGNSAADGETMS